MGPFGTVKLLRNILYWTPTRMISPYMKKGEPAQGLMVKVSGAQNELRSGTPWPRLLTHFASAM